MQHMIFVQGHIRGARTMVERSIVDSREKALVLTKLDEAMLWLGKTTMKLADDGETQETRRQPGLDPEAD